MTDIIREIEALVDAGTPESDAVAKVVCDVILPTLKRRAERNERLAYKRQQAPILIEEKRKRLEERCIVVHALHLAIIENCDEGGKSTREIGKLVGASTALVNKIYGRELRRRERYAKESAKWAKLSTAQRDIYASLHMGYHGSREEEAANIVRHVLGTDIYFRLHFRQCLWDLTYPRDEYPNGGPNVGTPQLPEPILEKIASQLRRPLGPDEEPIEILNRDWTPPTQ